MKFLPLVLKNLLRSKLRSTLTALAIVFLVILFSMIGTVLVFLEDTMTEKSRDVPVVISERFRIPSRFDRGYMDKIMRDGYELNTELRKVEGFHPEKSNFWHFIVFTLDEKQKDPDQVFFLIATDVDKFARYTEGLEHYDDDGAIAALMRTPPRSRLPNTGIILGPDRLAMIGKKVGDVVKGYSISHREGTGARKPIEMQMEIVAALPAGSRWSNAGFMDYTYLDRVLKEKQNELDGKVNLGWLILDDQPSVTGVGGVIERTQHDIKSESAATATSRFMESFKSIFWGVKYLLVPAIVVVMVVVVANAISITVRERTTEIAVLKVLGFGRAQILTLVLGEALFLGIVGGLIGSAITFASINYGTGGIRIPIVWFSAFYVPRAVFWWGPVLGGLTAFLGGIVPAWSACRVKVSEVFARVA